MVANVRSRPLYAELYHWYNKGSERNCLGACRQLILDHARGDVLEIGSGTG